MLTANLKKYALKTINASSVKETRNSFFRLRRKMFHAKNRNQPRGGCYTRQLFLPKCCAPATAQQLLNALNHSRLYQVRASSGGTMMMWLSDFSDLQTTFYTTVFRMIRIFFNKMFRYKRSSYLGPEWYDIILVLRVACY